MVGPRALAELRKLAEYTARPSFAAARPDTAARYLHAAAQYAPMPAFADLERATGDVRGALAAAVRDAIHKGLGRCEREVMADWMRP